MSAAFEPASSKPRPGASSTDATTEERTAEEAGKWLDAVGKRPQVDFEIEFFEQILCRNPDDVQSLVALGHVLSDRRLFQRALKVDVRLTELQPGHPVAMYNLACSYAQTGQLRPSMAALRRAVEFGFDDVMHIANDPDLEPIRSMPEFESLLQQLNAASR